MGEVAAGRGRRRLGLPRSLTGTQRVWLLNTLLILVALELFFLVVVDLPQLQSPFRIPWWGLAVAFFLTEVYVVHFEFRRDAQSFALGEIPLVLGLFFTGPVGVVAAHLTGAAAALIFHRRQSSTKLVFNLGHFAVETCIATIVFASVINLTDPVGPMGWLGTFLATAGSTLLGVLLVFAAISLSEGRLQLEKLPEVVVLGMIVGAANTSLAVIAALILWQEPAGVWLLAIPAAILFLGYRAYMAERSKHQSLEFLYDTTRDLQNAEEVDGAMLTLLARARSMFRADVAEALMFTADGGPALRTTIGSSEVVELRQYVDFDETRSVWARALEGEAILVTRAMRSDFDGTHLARRGAKDAMIAPLMRHDRTVGLMIVTDRMGDVTTFDTADLRLFETLVNHASVALEKDRLEDAIEQLTELEEQLTHQAFHDALTNLANRSLFSNRVEHALARRDALSNAAGVIFLDLDDFKTINDSYGHSAGDQLLIAVAERIRACVRPEDTAARLGGDEFAILLEETTLEEAAVVAERIIKGFTRPFLVAGHEVFVRTSVGIAMSAGDQSATEVLRNADVAMYRAKTHGKARYEVFRPDMHVEVLRRMELKAQLERAVDKDEFRIRYQPLVDIPTGRIIGFEALVRWEHPTRGMVAPAEFISLAEETGLVLPIGSWVLQEACRQAKEWQSATGKNDLTISVNLSPRQLQESDLVAQVKRVLAETGLDPSCLMLEITEHVLMEDLDVTLPRLHELKEVGVRLAIDDFGTGYSSLSYLRHLPIHVLKIAKSFIDGVAKDIEESALARAIIKLGATMNLSTIAEGIENAEQLDQLRILGCSMGQGFYLYQPMSVAEVEGVLAVEAKRDVLQLSL